ncbi:hypothetical protein AVEN_241743-1 [Araneus ventricosus]|uniref:Uncharacterized protein n=1 Tax=Araneus ventricosus TaxID=182803 RepID=A0A4Y2GTN8_ARAVE|nr:hypothetical protein AVEN_241743-1 [Araneus ventricosus]
MPKRRTGDGLAIVRGVESNPTQCVSPAINGAVTLSWPHFPFGVRLMPRGHRKQGPALMPETFPTLPWAMAVPFYYFSPALELLGVLECDRGLDMHIQLLFMELKKENAVACVLRDCRCKFISRSGVELYFTVRLRCWGRSCKISSAESEV